ncbi:MAG: hypothetical protein JSR53_03230 [Proteobacteria bacterium]|nr:hypothetical protein [Pseudomonadota bacterium]
MQLEFLDFDYSEDEEGTATWDAVASVPAARLPRLEQEIVTLLDWAHEEFGPLRGPVETGGLWDYDLQCECDGQPLLALSYAPETGHLEPRPPSWPHEHVTLTLSLSGGPAFAQAFAARFGPI